MKPRTLALLAAAAGVFIVGSVSAVGVCLFMFRDPWTIQTMRSDGVDHMYRVNRDDGRVEVMTSNGWKPAGRPKPVTASNPQELPLLSCEQWGAMKAKGETTYTDLFYRIPTDCP